LDVMTGGLVLLAKDARALAVAEDAFARHALAKGYRALVRGCPTPKEAILTAYLRKDAERARVRVLDRAAEGTVPIETRYRVVEAGEEISRVEIGLITGRTHQIRAHMAHIGHPILGDDKYGDRAFNRDHGARRQKLWATRLVLWDGRAFEVEEGF
ncbi:MAG: RNA pseudouridine synthase, partial [Firmicutes bacterium]|nr:RNA pseudouridine synthase [Bacillota bacterium]